MNNHHPPERSAVIHACDLHIGYKNEVIVADLNFQVEPGQSLALLGVNGSGKSTLLKTLVGLLPPLKGELTVFGVGAGKTPRRIGYLSQFHAAGFILPLRAVDVVRMGRFADHGLFGKMTAEDDRLIEQSMERMGVRRLADLPLRSLSGGQLQRVYIAQVLARRADLLVLDEPTAGLDAGGKELYQAMIRDEIKRGAVVVVATHDIQEAAGADQTMLLARKVIALGRGQEIITSETLLEAFGLVITLNNQNHGPAVVEREHAHSAERHGPGV
jgi:ABC-type Mn2+/Zn2+ transport system ATPase subunit